MKQYINNIFLCFLLLPLMLSAQSKKKSFCGWKVNDTAFMHKELTYQLNFLNIKDNDTIIDVGAASGAYEGILATMGNFKNVHFILVDIDTNCLNKTKLNNMLAYYSAVKGELIQQNFTLINNTVDSLFLPLQSYSKVWLMNTLHEIPNRKKMVTDIYNILKPGGEVIVLELLSTPKHTIHSGCNKPLMDAAELKTIFENNGFEQIATAYNPNNQKNTNTIAMIRFTKK